MTTDNIWITSRVRMQVEQKYRVYNKFFHLLFSYYSLLTIATAVFEKELSNEISHLPQINIIISVALFSLSLVISGFNFEKSAEAHRSCYLKLQALLAEPITDQEKNAKYHTIILDFPNHCPRDYYWFVFDRKILNCENLVNSQGPIPLGWPRIIVTVGMRLMIYVMAIAAFAWPIIVLTISFLTHADAS